jgi:hypothetical protein
MTHFVSWRRWGIVFTLAALVFGCNAVLSPPDDDDGDGFGGGGFTNAPQSPGGTGGVVDPESVEAKGEETQSFFKAFQIDPEEEDTAGPKFVISADIDRDGMLDMVSAWNESQPVQLHLQRLDADGNTIFKTISLAGTSPVAVVAGLEVGRINADEWLDVVVLIKSTGAITVCPPPPEVRTIGVMDGEIMVLFNPGSAAELEVGSLWRETILTQSNRFPGLDAADFYASGTRPEVSGFTALAVGELDGQPGDDIVVAFNAAECESLGQKPPINTVELYPNPGAALAEDGTAWSFVNIESDAPQVKDVVLLDVDADGDLDIISTWTNSTSRNIRWARNPFVAHFLGGQSGTEAVLGGPITWEHRPVGQVATAADIITVGDMDGDGFEDVIVRSSRGQLVQWFRRPTGDQIEPVFPPDDPVPPGRDDFPWQVYTLAEFDMQEPEAIAVGDVTGDGQVELIVAAEGAVFWFDGSVGTSRYAPWASNAIIRDSPAEQTAPGGGAAVPPGTTPGAGVTATDVSTHINSLLVVDLDGDGRNDIVATLDRRSGSGLSDDRLVWYRNTRTTE